MSFTDAGQKIVEGVAAGLYEGAAIIMAGADVLVPVQYGTLKRSGQIEDPVETPDTISVTCGFGYGAAYDAVVAEEVADAKSPEGLDSAELGYGFWVHERVIIETYKGRPAKNAGKPVYHSPPTQAKFLSVPAKAFEPDFGPVLEQAIQAKLRS